MLYLTEVNPNAFITLLLQGNCGHVSYFGNIKVDIKRKPSSEAGERYENALTYPHSIAQAFQKIN